jgi:hypothetical protein
MKRWHKVALGVLSHWFFLYLPLFILAVFGLIATTATAEGHGRGGPGPLFAAGIVVLFAVHFASILLMIGTQILYVVHAIKHPRFEAGNQRVLWVLLLVFLGVFAVPIYFWMFIKPQELQAPFFGTKETP